MVLISTQKHITKDIMFWTKQTHHISINIQWPNYLEVDMWQKRTSYFLFLWKKKTRLAESSGIKIDSCEICTKKVVLKHTNSDILWTFLETRTVRSEGLIWICVLGKWLTGASTWTFAGSQRTPSTQLIYKQKVFSAQIPLWTPSWEICECTRRAVNTTRTKTISKFAYALPKKACRNPKHNIISRRNQEDRILLGKRLCSWLFISCVRTSGRVIIIHEIEFHKIYYVCSALLITSKR